MHTAIPRHAIREAITDDLIEVFGLAADVYLPGLSFPAATGLLIILLVILQAELKGNPYARTSALARRLKMPANTLGRWLVPLRESGILHGGNGSPFMVDHTKLASRKSDILILKARRMRIELGKKLSKMDVREAAPARRRASKMERPT
jgi:hypothetical protein